MNKLVAESLSKSFVTGKTTLKAVNNLSFSAGAGELFGIIGPDGAGKTTLFRMLTTLMLPDSGIATVDGKDLTRDYREIRKTVGYMPGRFSLYQDLTVRENLDFFATIFNTTVKENYTLVKDIYEQIERFADRPAGKLSGGMKQKLALCCALIHRPSVLFLDEPTTGVDTVSRKEFWEMLSRLTGQGITTIVSTPYMDEASLCNRVALMQKGSVMSLDTPAGIVKGFGNVLLAIKSADMYSLLQEAARFPGVKDIYPFGEYHHVVMKEDGRKDEFRSFLHAGKHHDAEVIDVEAGIEDCFIALMKKQEQK